MQLSSTVSIALSSYTDVVHDGWAYSSRWEPLLSDLLRVSKALEGLGFRYINGEVVLLDGEVMT